jgi:alkanesulfonate monooxygenase SsuD/methylene tetrahydromethanopterin reductase-like flavin-dependent oxidoreductase (luciferase family)
MLHIPSNKKDIDGSPDLGLQWRQVRGDDAAPATSKTLRTAMSFFLAVALDRQGWRPSRDGDPATIFSASYWAHLAEVADTARLDFLTIEDTFAGDGRPEAVLLAARLAPVTSHVGLIPVATTTHTEPFHLSTSLATVDHISNGRAGWQVRVSARPSEAPLLGRREPLPLDELFAEAADAVEVVRRLWDSWQDDAIIKDVATGRFIDRDRLHYIDFTGAYFSVKGPSIVPRSPQGQPVVAALAHTPEVLDFAARVADIAFVTPALGVAPPVVPSLKIFVDLTVAFAGDAVESDAAGFAGTPEQLADLLSDWHGRGAYGFRLRPAHLPEDLEVIARDLVPLLEARGLWQPHPGTLRERLGLSGAVNRYEKGASVA